MFLQTTVIILISPSKPIEPITLITGWAPNQGSDGMLAEQFKETTPDSPEGRVMSDVSSMFLLEVLELLRWANDTTTLEIYYPTVKRAAQWAMDTTAVLGKPDWRLELSLSVPLSLSRSLFKSHTRTLPRSLCRRGAVQAGNDVRYPRFPQLRRQQLLHHVPPGRHGRCCRAGHR